MFTKLVGRADEDEELEEIEEEEQFIAEEDDEEMIANEELEFWSTHDIINNYSKTIVYYCNYEGIEV